MVAFLAGSIVFLMFVISGLLATIHRRDERIAELEALHAPAASEPRSVVRARKDVPERDTVVDLPRLFDLEGNDEPTKVCPVMLPR